MSNGDRMKPLTAQERLQLESWAPGLRARVLALLDDRDRLDALQERTQHWLDEWQGTAAAQTIKLMQLRSLLQEAFIKPWVVSQRDWRDRVKAAIEEAA